MISVRKSAVIVLTIDVILFIYGCSCGGCRQNFTRFGSHCYILTNNKTKYSIAEQVCKFFYKGSKLPVPLNNAENQELIGYSISVKSGDFWIGLKTTEAPFAFQDWNPGQPDESGECVRMSSSDKLWDDINCNDLLKTICLDDPLPVSPCSPVCSPNKQFCEQTKKTCQPCHHVCHGCHGTAENDCRICAPGYQRNFTGGKCEIKANIEGEIIGKELILTCKLPTTQAAIFKFKKGNKYHIPQIDAVGGKISGPNNSVWTKTWTLADAGMYYCFAVIKSKPTGVSRSLPVVQVGNSLEVLGREDAMWKDWQGWRRCSVTCGGGKRTRVRICDERDPGGKPCTGLSGPKTQTKNCGQVKCKGTYQSPCQDYDDCDDTASFYCSYQTGKCDCSPTHYWSLNGHKCEPRFEPGSPCDGNQYCSVGLFCLDQDGKPYSAVLPKNLTCRCPQKGLRAEKGQNNVWTCLKETGQPCSGKDDCLSALECLPGNIFQFECTCLNGTVLSTEDLKCHPNITEEESTTPVEGTNQSTTKDQVEKTTKRKDIQPTPLYHKIIFILLPLFVLFLMWLVWVTFKPKEIKRTKQTEKAEPNMVEEKTTSSSRAITSKQHTSDTSHTPPTTAHNSDETGTVSTDAASDSTDSPKFRSQYH